VVLDDGYDPQLLAAVATVPADVRPVTAIRRGLTVTLREMPPDTIAEIRAQVRLMLGVPALRAKMGEQSLTQALVFTEVIAGRSGRPATDLMVRAAAAALTGAIGAAVLAWIALPDDEGDEGAEGLIRMTDEALGALEAGFPFG
jgi:AcrR family transcriptional regulator